MPKLKEAILTFVKEAANIELDLVIKDSVGEPNGKWPKDLGNAMIMRLEHFNIGFVEHIRDALDKMVETVLEDVSLGALDILGTDTIKEGTAFAFE